MNVGKSTTYLDFYSILGVDPQASRREIEIGYAVVLNSMNDGGFFGRFKAFWFNRTPETLSLAHQTLMDPVSRAVFDAKYKRQNAMSFAPPY